MGKSKPVIVNHVLFPTKGELTKHLREMIAGYAVGTDVEGADRDFCMALFAFHPDADLKLVSGVKRVEVRLDTYGNKHFQIHRNDGTDDDISWTWCVRHTIPVS